MMSTNGILTDVDPFSELPLDRDDNKADMESPLGGKENDITEAIDETANESPYAEPLIPEQVRWFHKDCVDKRWIEFCGYDSLRIERAWRTRNSSLTHNGENKTEQQIVVRGGMYDVELDEMKCRSIYCADEESEIMRGTWFYEGSWIPLDMEHTKVIEEVHLNLFQKPSSESDCISERNTPSHSYKALHTERFPEFHVDWHAINDVVSYSEYTPSKLVRSVTSKLGFSKTTGYRLKRGYKTLAVMDDKPYDDIDHLVFVVHGIGHKGDTNKVIRNTTSFRDCVDWLKKKYFPKSHDRVEFIPVKWRSSLKLDDGIVEAITPTSVLSIRHILNTSAMDILYYTSPLYGGEVRNGLQLELNRLYLMFVNRHPDWKGKVSILAHSLGCVIVYDIVTGWMDIGAENYPKPVGLRFKIDNLFCLGSPLSVFLALRKRTSYNKSEVMPTNLCNNFYNIFHWSDPVAYRMEPLLEREYSNVNPVLIPPYGGIEGQHQQSDQNVLQPMNNVVDANLQPNEPDERDDSGTDQPIRNVDKSWSVWNLMPVWNTKDGVTSPTPETSSQLRPDQELSQRLDYVLRAVGFGQHYFYSVLAHTAYWNNYDVAYFVLTRIFPKIET